MTLKEMLSVLIRVLEGIADLCVASVLWLLCSLPVVTVGAANAALYYTVVKVVRRQRGTIPRCFFQSFRRDLRQSIPLTLLFLVGCGLIALYILLGESFMSPNSGMYIAYWVVVAILGAVFVSTALYAFPLLSRFEEKTLSQIKNAFFLSAASPIRSFGMVCLLALAVYLLFKLPIGLLFLPGLYALLTSMVIEPIFRKYAAEVGRSGWFSDEE